MSAEPASWSAAKDTPAPQPPAYSRDALEKELRDGFRKQQQQVSKDRKVEQLALAKGLGELAVTSLKDGHYTPHRVLPPLKPDEKKLFERINFRNWLQRVDENAEKAAPVAPPVALEDFAGELTQIKGDPTSPKSDTEDSVSVSICSTTPSLAALKGNCADDVREFLHQLRSTSRVTASIHDARSEMEDNIQTVEAALFRQCAPLSFEQLLDTASRVLAAMERGDLTEDVVVPREMAVNGGDDEAVPNSADSTEGRSSLNRPPTRVLHGAVEVEAYTRECLLPKAYKTLAIAHTSEWMLQYTMAYLRTTPAVNTDEALTRLNLLARCVRLLGDMENFSSILLSLETKCEEYAGFVALREAAESHISTLLNELESSLDAVLSAPFPSRRARLLLVERGIQKNLQRAMLFLNEIDYSWTPHVRFHWVWKVQLLTSSFHRIHGSISQKYMKCSMGFVDGALQDQVADTRITGRYLGASPNQPKVPRVQQVEYERITEGFTLPQIGMSVKGLASLIVGEQLCMGARYLLRQSTKEFDPIWKFHMDEVCHIPTEEDISREVEKMSALAKRRFVAKQNEEKKPGTLTFITES
ncbi:hypothetical protein JKF63_01881 [Porcisia hertigi]|uniref:Uncharacterized protein n=1 Tax=Porcisia hertigi TaxID=2761500 RepID=A0A836L1R9_9TRYP|nr:hypothetical protein JKF63_01881 [Porcisia hertigi]